MYQLNVPIYQYTNISIYQFLVKTDTAVSFAMLARRAWILITVGGNPRGGVERTTHGPARVEYMAGGAVNPGRVGINRVGWTEKNGS